MRKNSRKRNPLMALIMVIVLITLIISGCAEKGEKEAEKEPEAPSIVGYFAEGSVDNTASVQINTGEISYTITNSVVPEIDGYSSRIIDNFSLFGMLLSVEKIPYTGKIEAEAGKLSEYGLDKTDKYLTTTYLDETVVKVLIGNKASDFEYYAMIENDEFIYTIPVDYYDFVMKHPSEHRSKQVCTLDDTSIKALEIEKNGEKEVKVVIDENFVPTNEYQTTSYLVTYPYENKTASLVTLQYLFETIGTIEAESIVEEDPADLEKYGLSPAATTIHVTDSSGKTTLKIGNEKDGKVYLMCDDIPVVYLAECALYEQTKKYKASDYVEKFVGLHYIWDVLSIDLKKGKKSHSMEMVTDSQNIINYKLDGKAIVEGDFKDLYQLVIGLSVEDFVDEVPEGELYAEITYKFKDSTQATYKYYDYNDKYCIVTARNNLVGLVSKASIDEMFNSLTKEK